MVAKIKIEVDKVRIEGDSDTVEIGMAGTTGVNIGAPVDLNNQNISNSGTLNGKAPADLVTGPISSVDNEIARYDGITGKLLQGVSGNATLNDNGDLICNTINCQDYIAAKYLFASNVAAGNPYVLFYDGTVGTNEHLWSLGNYAGDYFLNIVSDDELTILPVFTVARNAMTVTSFTLHWPVKIEDNLDMDSNNVNNIGSVAHRTLHSESSSSGGVTFDFSVDDFIAITLSENVTAPVLTAPSGPGRKTIIVTQGGSPYTMTGWASSVKWVGGTPPSIPAAAGSISKIEFVYDGTNWLGDFGASYS